MSKGLVIKGGGRNKVTGGSIELDEPGSIGVEMEDTFDNEIEDVQIYIGGSIKEIKQMQEAISNIQDSSINNKTGNEFKSEVLHKLPELMRYDDKGMISSQSVLELISLLSSWITIQSYLAPKLLEYIGYLITLLGA